MLRNRTLSVKSRKNVRKITFLSSVRELLWSTLSVGRSVGWNKKKLSGTIKNNSSKKICSKICCQKIILKNAPSKKFLSKTAFKKML